MSSNNIIQIQKLFDKHIYSLYDENSLIEIEEEEKTIENRLSWDNIYEFFSCKEDFYSSIKIYAGTTIYIPSPNDYFEICLLIASLKETPDGIRIKHHPKGLRFYLYRQPYAEINNGYLKGIFMKSFERYKMKGDVLYSFLTKGYQYNCTPEELKQLLGINYINSMLKVKILSPAENTLKNLFDKGEIPFYFKTNFDRSIMTPGNRIINIQFIIVDNIIILRQKRLRPEHMHFIISQLIKLLPFDYPFIEEELKQRNDATIEDIYKMIRDIEKDPDYHKIAPATLIKFKLNQNFGIKMDY